MRIYLDICCYNRKFDDSADAVISRESKSVFKIQTEIVKKNIELVTSFMLHYENYRKKDSRQRDSIDLFIKTNRKIYVGVDSVEDLKILADKIVASGIKQKDAYHIACAIFADCDYFLTVDKRLLKYSCKEIKILNPVDFLEVFENG